MLELADRVAEAADSVDAAQRSLDRIVTVWGSRGRVRTRLTRLPVPVIARPTHDGGQIDYVRIKDQFHPRRDNQLSWLRYRAAPDPGATPPPAHGVTPSENRIGRLRKAGTVMMF